MPFTLSHVAAALPGIRADGRGRGPLVASALVAGTLAPDTLYYAASVDPRIMRLGEYTHSALGTVTVDVLLAAALLGVWLLLREPLLALLPEGARGRAYVLTRGRPWRGRPLAGLLPWCWVSAALGAATHVLWDSFTHMDRWGVRWISVLDERVLGVPLYHQLQYGGSAVALVAVAAFLVRAWRRLPHAPVPALPVFSVLPARGRAGAVALLGAAAVAGAVHRCARRAGAEPEAVPWDGYVPTVLFGAGAGAALALPLYAVALRAVAAARDRRASRTPGAGAPCAEEPADRRPVSG
ncbi:DUF4184 family protein [Streptomyces radiopugnans]|uniref:DUF4184 family protein n=1 Tax=Streptomyces radiopugnans TaxID=403935 RepID=UPI003F1CECB0